MAMAIAALLGEWLCVRRELQDIPLGRAMCLRLAQDRCAICGGIALFSDTECLALSGATDGQQVLQADSILINHESRTAQGGREGVGRHAHDKQREWRSHGHPHRQC